MRCWCCCPTNTRGVCRRFRSNFPVCCARREARCAWMAMHLCVRKDGSMFDVRCHITRLISLTTTRSPPCASNLPLPSPARTSGPFGSHSRAPARKDQLLCQQQLSSSSHGTRDALLACQHCLPPVPSASPPAWPRHQSWTTPARCRSEAATHAGSRQCLAVST